MRKKDKTTSKNTGSTSSAPKKSGVVASVLETIEERKGQARLVTIGEVDGRILLVACTWRNETRRIISGPASRKEIKHYQDAIGRRLD